MKVSEEHDLVAAYALSALDELEMRRFERHLDSCKECQRDLAELQQATTVLADLSAENAPAGLRKDVLAQIPVPERRRSPAWLIATAAAVLALVFGGLWATSTARLTHLEQVAAVYEAADANALMLTGIEGEGRFTYSASLGTGVFVSRDLAAAPADSTYELWLIDDTGPHPAGLFEADDSVLVEGAVAGVHVIAVTLEPAGGSELPTGPVLLSGEL